MGYGIYTLWYVIQVGEIFTKITRYMDIVDYGIYIYPLVI